MSSKLIKSGSPIEIPGDSVMVDLKVFASGKIQLQAPQVHVKDLIKILDGLKTDLIFEAFQPKENKLVDTSQVIQ